MGAVAARGLNPELVALHAALGIRSADLKARRLRIVAEARRLVPVGVGTDGRDKFLAPVTARAWRSLCAAAARDGVVLELVSGFRSIAFQAALIRQKLARGDAIADILRINAPPGYSEHHSGHALDIGTPGCGVLDVAFEQTEAFAWLRQHAKTFRFHLSYPPDNPQGFLYEPWHWCHRPPAR